MFVELCNCLVRNVTYYIIKMLLWLLQRILKVTIRYLIFLVVILNIFVYLWCWTKSDNIILEKHSYIPTVMWWTEGLRIFSDTRYCPNNIKCKVYALNNITKHLNVHGYLFCGSYLNFSNVPLPRRSADIVWALYHEESPRNVEELMHESALKLFNYSSTYSRYSDVPFPLQHLISFDDITSEKYFINTAEKNEYLKKIAPILYLQSDCETSTERDAYVLELMKIIKIDSYGSCLNNQELPETFSNDYLNSLNEDGFLKFVAKYKFVIAIENGVCDDYVTEKFWRAIKVGTVPIYFGSPLIRDWLPNEKSAILLEDFPTPTILRNHINKLLINDDLYEEYLEHKTKGIVTNSKLINEFHERPYQIDFLETLDKFECFVCNKIHDKLNGKSDISTMSKNHYNCPKPLSALQLDVNPKNNWVLSWEQSKDKADELYNNIMNNV